MLGLTSASADDTVSLAPTLADSQSKAKAREIHSKSVGQLRTQVRNIWASDSLRLGTTAIYVVDAITGEELYKVHAQSPLNPASNVKLVSTATVLATLGPDWRFETKVVGPSPDTQGIVTGGIYLLGNYDPTLGPGGLQDLARQMSERGITEVHGNIVLSQGDIRDSLANKRIRVTLRGTAPGKRPKVEIWPAGTFASIDLNSAHSRKRGRTRISVGSRLIEEEGKEPHLSLSVRGSIRTGHKRVVHVLAQRRSSFTASSFRQALQDHGIDLLGNIEFANYDDFSARSSQSQFTSETLALHQSIPISQLVTRVNKRSLNYLADRLVMSAARSLHHGPLEMESAIVLMKSWLTSIGVDADKVVIDTGSGLSYKTQISTKQIVKILRAAGGYNTDLTSGSSVTFRNSLSIGGRDGTLRNRFRNQGVRLSGHVIGKTGTLTSVIALSGFLTHTNGRSLVFSIVTNGHKNELKRNVRLAHELIVGKLDRFLGVPGAIVPIKSELSPLLSTEAPIGAKASEPASQEATSSEAAPALSPFSRR